MMLGITGTEEELTSCLNALFPRNPLEFRQTIYNARGPRVEGTCEWVLRTPQYSEWKESASGILWISGDAGKEKTTVAIFLAEELGRDRSDGKSKILIEFFCNSQDEHRNSASFVIRALIKQLLDARPELFDHIRRTWQSQKT